MVLAWRGSRIILAAALLAVPAGPPARAEDPEIALRTYANADQLMKEGKIEQALRDFEKVANAYPDSDFADDALYRLGEYFYSPPGIDAVGTVPRDSVLRAREMFSRINAKYPSGDFAARALIKLGLIALDPQNPQRNLDDAYASFAGILNIYPDSDVVDQALFGAGYSDLLAGKLDKAIASFIEVAESYPGSPSAPAARYHMGAALLRQGHFVRSLEEFQKLRDLYPESPLAARALDRLTQVYKLKVQPELGIRPLFVQDRAYSAAIGTLEPRAGVSLGVDGGGVLHLLDPRSGAVLRLGHDGKLNSMGEPLPGAVSLTIGSRDQEVLAAGDRIRAGVEVVIPKRRQSGSLRAFEEITAAVRLGPGRTAFLDQDDNEVRLYEDDAIDPRLLYRDPEGRARLSGLAAGAGDKLYTIDRRQRQILEITTAATFREVPLPEDLRDALRGGALLAADDIGNLFILDTRSDSLVVMTTEGDVLERIESRPDTPGEFSYPAGLAVGARAEIYVYDEKSKKILRFW